MPRTRQTPSVTSSAMGVGVSFRTGGLTMPRYRSTSPDDRDAKIRRLEDELWFARTAIIELMPENARSLLTTHYQVSTRKDLFDWLHWLTRKVIDLSDKRPGEQMGDFPGTVRAYCPLCGEGSSGPYSRGYSIPLGLERHLNGTHRQRQCAPMLAADRLARDRVNEKERTSPGSAKGAGNPPWKEAEPAVAPAPPPPSGPGAAVLPFPRKAGTDRTP
ncbi:hypothetical protein RFUL19S_03085 [Rhizobacter fulvus]